MWMFIRLTVGVAVALVAFFVMLFMIKVIIIAAIVAALVVGVAALTTLFRRRGRLGRARRTDIVQRF